MIIIRYGAAAAAFCGGGNSGEHSQICPAARTEIELFFDFETAFITKHFGSSLIFFYFAYYQPVLFNRLEPQVEYYVVGNIEKLLALGLIFGV